MHKLMEYICDEMEELERKADKDGKLSMAEIQYLDMLAHTKKNLLKADEMMEESEYSMEGGSYRSNARGRGRSNEGSYRSYRSNEGGGSNEGSMARRSSRRSYRGNTSRADDMIEELRELMEEAPDDRTRQEFQRFITKMEQM